MEMEFMLTEGALRIPCKVCEPVSGNIRRIVLGVHGIGGSTDDAGAGTDAGAWSVPHGSQTEYSLLQEALGEQTDFILKRGISEIISRF